MVVQSTAVLAVIPYHTFPQISLGPLHLRTFGIMVGVGVLLGAWIAGRYVEARAGVPREETYQVATRLVVAGVVGSRITWDLSHLGQIHSPVDLIAVWKGGLQFSGGFLGAIVLGLPFFRRWTRRVRWIAADGYALGLSIGLAIGRVGCTSVGEHFGRLSHFALAVRYDGGTTREPTLHGIPLVAGVTTFHNTAIYEMLYLVVIFAILALVSRNGRNRVGTMMGLFCLLYGGLRFSSDFLRVNDEHILGLTGAQYLMAAIFLASPWIFFKVRPALEAEAAAADGDGPAEPAEPAESTGPEAEPAEADA